MPAKDTTHAFDIDTGIARPGGTAAVILWCIVIATPRGPAADIRPKPG